ENEKVDLEVLIQGIQSIYQTWRWIRSCPLLRIAPFLRLSCGRRSTTLANAARRIRHSRWRILSPYSKQALRPSKGGHQFRSGRSQKARAFNQIDPGAKRREQRNRGE